MKHDLPTQEQILEELADKVASHVDRNAPVAFESAFGEMVRYHRFLLSLNSTADVNGAPINYAEYGGNSWNPPHRKWTRQYVRLFERAVSRLPDDSRFLETLSYTPNYLLQSPDSRALSGEVIKGIIDLGPSLMHRIETWITKRTTLETRHGESAEPRLILAGSDAKAYENFLPNLIGAWESLLKSAPPIYRWETDSELSNDEEWLAFRSSWPFLWQHLSNTAYNLAVSVWNEDSAGAQAFSEALLRWPKTLHYRMDEYAYLQKRRLIYPSLLNLSWKECIKAIAPITFEHMPPPSPRDLLATIVRGLHEDVVLITAALLLFWTINEKQSSDIGARIARQLLNREHSSDDDDYPNHDTGEGRLQSSVLSLLRLEVLGGSQSHADYVEGLDHMARNLDNMTERSIVPGRLFTPSTIHGRGDLSVAIAAILASEAPQHRSEDLIKRIAAFTENEALLPGGDRSIRNVVQELDRWQSLLKNPSSRFDRGVLLLAPEANPHQSALHLSELTRSLRSVIQGERLARLKARQVDNSKLERIRLSLEKSLLTSPAKLPFFIDVQVGTTTPSDTTKDYKLKFDIEKALLVEPPMTSDTLDIEGRFVTHTLNAAGNSAWNSFVARDRQPIIIPAGILEAAFWHDIAPLAERVGPAPVLAISKAAEGRALSRFIREISKNDSKLKFEQRPRDGHGASYITTIEGVSVFGANFEPGTIWLFSARALRRIEYEVLEQPNQIVNLSFDLKSDEKGDLIVRFQQKCVWADLQSFDIRTER